MFCMTLQCNQAYVCLTTFLQVKLDVSVLEDIRDDWEFTLKLAKEESVVILPGKNQ